MGAPVAASSTRIIIRLGSIEVELTYGEKEARRFLVTLVSRPWPVPSLTADHG